jgi:hypothetical protein
VTDSTQPVNVFSAGDDPRSEYLVTSKDIVFCGGCTTPCNWLEVWAIHSPLSSSPLYGIFLLRPNNYTLPPPASQPGGANTSTPGTLASPVWRCITRDRSMRRSTPPTARIPRQSCTRFSPL